MDPTRRGEYGGVSEVGKTVSSFWAPAAYTYAAMRMGDLGWLLIGGWVTLATAGLHPAARAAERFAEAHFPYVTSESQDPPRDDGVRRPPPRALRGRGPRTAGR